MEGRTAARRLSRTVRSESHCFAHTADKEEYTTGFVMATTYVTLLYTAIIALTASRNQAIHISANARMRQLSGRAVVRLVARRSK